MITVAILENSQENTDATIDKFNGAHFQLNYTVSFVSIICTFGSPVVLVVWEPVKPVLTSVRASFERSARQGLLLFVGIDVLTER